MLDDLLQSSMRFPSDLKISQPAKDLIMSLCTSSKDRLGYEGITSHKYFNNVLWNKLQTSMQNFINNTVILSTIHSDKGSTFRCLMGVGRGR